MAIKATKIVVEGTVQKRYLAMLSEDEYVKYTEEDVEITEEFLQQLESENRIALASEEMQDYDNIYIDETED